MQPTTLFNPSSISGVSLVNFTIDSQVTVAALGLPAGAHVRFEMVQISSPMREQICPGSCEIPAVQFPLETAWQPLMCCEGQPVRVNAANPYVVLDAPQHVRLRALVVGYNFSAAPFPGEVIVYPSTSTITNDTMRGCCADPVVIVPPPPAPPPLPVYCPSLRLDVCDCNEIGFAYRDGDSKDPAATVQVLACDGTTVGYAYPTARLGATVPYEQNNVVIGFLKNRSECAPEASTVVNTYVTTNVAAPIVNNAFAPTTNVAAPTVVLPAPTVASQTLDANDAIVTTLTNGTVFTTPLSNC